MIIALSHFPLLLAIKQSLLSFICMFCLFVSLSFEFTMRQQSVKHKAQLTCLLWISPLESFSLDILTALFVKFIHFFICLNPPIKNNHR